mmetsp:Transcript_26307/g.91510  ORF Transcript_26307/g.91510 Transcript_26307/m.91510 type:complete len:288 (-) Transcript_26307:221-1084(-)
MDSSVAPVVTSRPTSSNDGDAGVSATISFISGLFVCAADVIVMPPATCTSSPVLGRIAAKPPVRTPPSSVENTRASALDALASSAAAFRSISPSSPITTWPVFIRLLSGWNSRGTKPTVVTLSRCACHTRTMRGWQRWSPRFQTEPSETSHSATTPSRLPVAKYVPRLFHCTHVTLASCAAAPSLTLLPGRSAALNAPSSGAPRAFIGDGAVGDGSVALFSPALLSVLTARKETTLFLRASSSSFFSSSPSSDTTDARRLPALNSEAVVCGRRRCLTRRISLYSPAR